MANVCSFKIGDASYTYDSEEYGVTKEQIVSRGDARIIAALAGGEVSKTDIINGNVEKVISQGNPEISEGGYFLFQPILYANYIDAMQLASKEKIIGTMHLFDQGYYVGNPALWQDFNEGIKIVSKGGNRDSSTFSDGTPRVFNVQKKDNGKDFLFVVFNNGPMWDVTSKISNCFTFGNIMLTGSNCFGIFDCSLTQL